MCGGGGGGDDGSSGGEDAGVGRTSAPEDIYHSARDAAEQPALLTGVVSAPRRSSKQGVNSTSHG